MALQDDEKLARAIERLADCVEHVVSIVCTDDDLEGVTAHTDAINGHLAEVQKLTDQVMRPRNREHTSV